jgi:hypothetical protein
MTNSDLQILARAALVPARPAPSIDPETRGEIEYKILAEMKSAAARLRGTRCEFSDKRAAAALDRARLDLIELINLDL